MSLVKTLVTSLAFHHYGLVGVGQYQEYYYWEEETDNLSLIQSF